MKARSLHAILYRESSNESTRSVTCLQQKDAEFWGTLLVSEKHTGTPEAVLGLCESACSGRPNENEYVVNVCLPGFGQVNEVISTRTWSRVESVKKEVLRKATAALSYSKETIGSYRSCARTKVCAAFRTKSANEVDQERLMKLFEHAVQVGAVVVVSSSEEVTWK